MKVLTLDREFSVKLSPKDGTALSPITIRWSVNQRKSPRVSKLGIVASNQDIAIHVFNEAETRYLPVYQPREITLHPQYAVTLTPKPGADARGVRVIVRHVHNHHAETGSCVISVEYPPDAFDVSPVFADEAGKTGNRGAR